VRRRVSKDSQLLYEMSWIQKRPCGVTSRDFQGPAGVGIGKRENGLPRRREAQTVKRELTKKSQARSDGSTVCGLTKMSDLLGKRRGKMEGA